MGDKNNAHAFGLEFTHHLEQFCGLTRIKAGGRFVQDEDSGRNFQSAGNGHHLLNSHRIHAQRLGYIHLNIHPRQNFFGPAVHCFPIYAALLAGGAANEDIFSDG